MAARSRPRAASARPLTICHCASAESRQRSVMSSSARYPPTMCQVAAIRHQYRGHTFLGDCHHPRSRSGSIWFRTSRAALGWLEYWSEFSNWARADCDLGYAACRSSMRRPASDISPRQKALSWPIVRRFHRLNRSRRGSSTWPIESVIVHSSFWVARQASWISGATKVESSLAARR